MRTIATAFIAATAVLCISPAASAFETVAVISGIASVRDGDDVTFGRVPVRLQGIAAPEDGSRNREPGGPEATENLRSLVDGRFVVCHLDGHTTSRRSARSAGICYLGTVDLGRYQVETGHARDCPAFSGGRYADAEKAAQEAGRDLSAIYDLPSYC